jgi:hypothetical protein
MLSPYGNKCITIIWRCQEFLCYNICMEVRRVAALLLIMLGCFFAGFVSRQPYQRSYPKNSHSAEESRQGLGSDSKNEASEHSKESDSDTPEWYATFKRPELPLVMLGVFTLLIIGWQSYETRRSAKAAQDGIELMISKERARLTVDLEDFKLTTQDGIYQIKFKINILGTTPAFIADAQCACGEFPLAYTEEPEIMDMAMIDIQSYPFFPKVIPPNSVPVEAYSFLFINENADTMLNEIKNDRLFVIVRGFIKYKDVFERPRETRFRYAWKYWWAAPIGSDERPGAWEKCGPEDQNTQA